MKRSYILFAACALASVFVLAPAGAQQGPTVMVNGSPMAFPDQPPVERDGRIYVPMRAIFERLGATVVYSNGTINATRGPRTIQLAIGSPTATVNGQQVQLDSPPFEIAARTLVPLRFVSQALGATVSWDEPRLTAYIIQHGGGGPMGRMQGGPVPPYHPGSSYQQPGPSWADYGHPLFHRPYPWGDVAQQYPLVNASFRSAMRPETVQVRLDGRNVTDISKITTRGFEFTPAFRLHVGTHTVSVTGITAGGQRLSDAWTFTVTP